MIISDGRDQKEEEIGDIIGSAVTVANAEAEVVEDRFPSNGNSLFILKKKTEIHSFCTATNYLDSINVE